MKITRYEHTVLMHSLTYMWAWGNVVVRKCATNRRVSLSIPSGVAGDFSVATDGIMYRGVDSDFKNEYQDNSWG